MYIQNTSKKEGGLKEMMYNTQVVNRYCSVYHSKNRRKSKKERREDRVIAFIVVSVIVLASCVLMYNVANYPEKYITTDRNVLLMQLNNGDEDAIEYYYSTYIKRDVYLFDGPLTIELMAKKNGLDYSNLYDRYKQSGYDNAQKFFDRYVNELVAIDNA